MNTSLMSGITTDDGNIDTNQPEFFSKSAITNSNYLTNFQVLEDDILTLKRELDDEIRVSSLRPGQENTLIEMTDTLFKISQRAFAFLQSHIRLLNANQDKTLTKVINI